MTDGQKELDSFDKAKVAVVQFPGVNCEYETARVLAECGMEPTLFRWNQDPALLETFDGFILPGGFSYQDRVRAGAVAAKDPIVERLWAEAEAGKPILGLCNGAQVLVESGMIPGSPHTARLALAPNRMTGRSGYYCRWVHLKIDKSGRETAFTSRFEDGVVVPIPMAHGEGRFTTVDPDLFHELEDSGQIPVRYCTGDGDLATSFPDNPNGALHAAAGLSNRPGNVLALMPHPERGSWLRQVPPALSGEWGNLRRRYHRSRPDLDGPGPGRRFFLSMLDYIRWRREREAEPAGKNGEGVKLP
jgi:phosphoribosylformylglycinamidine synthase I